jgi:arginyl-tRNA synthetase
LITKELARRIEGAFQEAKRAGDLDSALDTPTVELELPRSKQHGDFASNVALALAKPAGLPPREVAARLLSRLAQGDGTVERIEIAGPGFLNFHLTPRWLHDALVEIEAKGNAYGRSNDRSGEKVLIEFVSANPTGPISVVNGRAAALGDSLGNLLAACGAEVSREFYVNDALNSTQLDLMGDSLAARYLQQLGREASIPEEGYHGEYLADIARDLIAEAGDRYVDMPVHERSRAFRAIAAERMVEQQRADLEAFGVAFDRWFYESSLYQSGAVRESIREMTERGHTYEKEGALWLRTTELCGDDQDRVLVRSNEKETYVAADAAYHGDKFSRGFNRLIDIWGADHHGYVSRLKSGVAALGHDPDQCEIILTQMVMLMRGGIPVRGSKRAGDIIPLAELIEEIGRDAARYYFLLNSYETTATFDLEVARKQSNDNPVFYAQYGHARCCNVLRRAEELNVALKPAAETNRSLLVHDKELELLRKLAGFPKEVNLAASMLAPHRLTALMREIGQALHQFYEECPALKEGVPPDLRDARLAVFNAARIVTRNLLALLGVTAPERM